MDKEKFGKFAKIRNAVREIASEKALQDGRASNTYDIRNAFDRLRLLKMEDPDAAAEDVGYWNAQKEIRESMGDSSYQLYATVSDEKWDIEMGRVLAEYGKAIETAEAGDELTEISYRFFSEAMQRADAAVEEDPRIKKEFAGREAILRDAAAKGLEILWPIFKRMLRHRQELEDEGGDTQTPPPQLH